MRSDDLDPEVLSGLLRRIAQRDESSLYTLHRHYAKRIYAFVIHRSADHHLADSVVSDTLYEVWRKPEAFRGESRFSTWLLGIARNKMLVELRRNNRPHDDIEDHADTLESDSPAPGSALEQSQDEQALRDCLQRLSGVQRECMHLAFYEELGLAEIARLQAVPEGTVKTRLFHARRNLRICIERQPVTA
jgi:RNA polymerase sigma-70 factor (ECF subfamily)